LDGGRSRHEEDSANKHAEATRSALEDALSIAFAETETTRLEVDGAQEQVAALEAAVATAQELVARTQVGLREGANTLIDVLDAARTLREIQDNLIEARVTLATAQARYLRATGTLLGELP
jgi:outer membrane protein TolC